MFECIFFSYFHSFLQVKIQKADFVMKMLVKVINKAV